MDGFPAGGGYPGGMPGGFGGMPGMGGPMGMMDSEEMKSMRRIGEWVTFIIDCFTYAFYAACALFACYILFRLALYTPAAASFLGKVARRRRSNFERATALAIGSVALPIVIAQVGLMAGPLLPPVVGWKIYVYGSSFSGCAAAILGARALRYGDASLKTRATVALVSGAIVLSLVYASTRLGVSARHQSGGRLPMINDFTTDVDDPPHFSLLADANHTAGYPPKYVPLLREYFDDVLSPKTTSLPIGAAFIRSLTLAKEFHWTVVTPVRYNADGYVEPSEWMDKDEIIFEATSTSSSPVFRIPDEIVVRIRHHTFDDGYTGAKVDIRSRGHTRLPNDRGSNVARVRHFVSHETW